MATESPVGITPGRLFLGFVGGFLATLVFHQLALWILAGIGFVQANVYVMRGVPPFGIPQVISLAFWGGLWGVLFSAVDRRFPAGVSYWISAFAFGAIAPTLVAWFVVASIKGQPVAAGWQIHRMITGLIINGAWAVGTALFLAVTTRRNT
jgi:hypothetical protein